MFRPVLATAEELTGVRYGADAHTDVSLRILADHARAMAMLVADGVLPSNEGRGYVLRRVIRRAVRRAFQLGVIEPVTPRPGGHGGGRAGRRPTRCSSTTSTASPSTVEREEGAFRRTLDAGLGHPRGGAARPVAAGCPGDVAFRLHDTHGFPIELTMEMAAEAGVEVDAEGFERAMATQREHGPGRRPPPAPGARRRDRLPRAARPVGARRASPATSTTRSPTTVVAVLAGAEPGTRRDRPRPHPVLRRVRRPGGRHRGHHHRDGPGHACTTPRAVAARADRAPRHVGGRAASPARTPWP